MGDWSACTTPADQPLQPHLHDAARRPDGVHAQLQVGQVVQRVEDAEDVDAVRDRDFSKAADGIVGVARVADGVRAAQQHCEGDARHRRPQRVQAVPGALAQEAQAHVERRAAPHF